MNFCPWCGTRVGGHYCGGCGAPLSDEALATRRATTREGGEPAYADGATANDLVALSPDAPEPGGTHATSSTRWWTRPRTFSHSPARTLSLEQRDLSRETRWVMFAFLVSGIVGAVVVLAEGVSGTGDVSRFPSIVASRPVLNMILGMIAYVPTLAVVPLALFLMARTGQDRRVLGIGAPKLMRDVVPGLGLAAAAFGVEVAMLIPLSSFLDHSRLATAVTTAGDPRYYLIEGIFMSAVTAVTEEVLVNGYFLTRLAQLGWTPRSALIVSLVLRTSYHIYYGIGFVLTIPLGYFVTRSFQKHGKLNRPIWAHFLYDAILFTISMLR